MRTKILYTSLFFLLLNAFPTMAQCAMCRAVLESGEGQKVAESVNDGIVYLMIIPYILMAGVGYYMYKSRKKMK